jgi:hypothetical protein
LLLDLADANVGLHLRDFGQCGAFTIEDQNTRKQFEVEYSKTAPLYYCGQIPLDKILARIQRELARL